MPSTADFNDNQIYTGIDPQDLTIFEKYRNPAACPTPGFYTDFMGVRTRLSYFGVKDTHFGESVGEIPFPSDGLHAEAVEYVAALYAVDTSAPSSFTAVELGAGYGPWLAFSAKAAQHKGVKKINVIAVEGDRPRLALLRTHFEDNGLPVPDQSGSGVLGDVRSKLVHGAISDTNGTVTFGSQSVHDWGAAPVENGEAVDYRGLEISGEAVDSYTIEHVIRDLPSVDFLHMDIQGFEARAVRASLDALLSKVRVMLIATHSRQIEGELFEMLFGHGWRIFCEKPCKFARKEANNLVALTTVDGTQVWVNTALDEQRKSLEALGTVKAQTSQHELNVALERTQSLERKLEQANESIAALRREVAALRDSTSWKVTAPLRKLRSVIH
ncbi:FkbM family methyltransferase [Paraburkholderia sp. J12]|uniref:FkbM family methyltransferase n=1 Tax=Paraburkholderia sp. J12 TaxID=2805432 RepID=UPI002ABD7D7D|nr:FkbM family methyltransferase [Paraburkholderia sp. J12]